MTDQSGNGTPEGPTPSDHGEDPPQSPATSPLFGSTLAQPAATPWYKRRTYLIAAAVLVIAAGTVLTDLPQHASPQVQITGDASVITSVGDDVQSCVYAVKESLNFYRDEQGHGTKLTSGDRAMVPSLLGQDQQACSFTNQGILDLADIEVPGSAAGKYMTRLVVTVTDWATSDALAAIEAIQTLWSTPGDTKELKALSRAEGELHSDRAAAASEVESADKILNARLPSVGLPALAS